MKSSLAKKPLRFFGVLSLFFLFLPKAAIAQQGLVPDSVEYVALKALYDATNGPAWTNKTNWLNGVTSADFATWHGLTVSNGDVTSIVLSTNNLTGSFPAEVANLTMLHTLKLNGNKLSGALPAGIGSLIRLQYLELQYNTLSGSLPSSLGNLSDLRIINLMFNRFLGTVPDTYRGWQKIDRIYFGYNYGLEGTFPECFCDLPTVRIISLHSNKFTGSFPSCLLERPNLYQLDLIQNNFSGTIPENIGDKLNLNALGLQNNAFSGTIPRLR